MTADRLPTVALAGEPGADPALSSPARSAFETVADRRPVVFVVCYRAFDIRLMVSSGVLAELSRLCEVVLFAPAPALPTLQRMLGNVRCEALRYPGSDFVDAVAEGAGLADRFRTIFCTTAGLIYGRRGKANLTGILHRRTFRARLAGQGFKQRLVGLGILLLAEAGSRFRPVRRLVQRSYAAVTRNDVHSALFDRYRPALVVVCSLGLSADGRMLREAQRAGVATAAVVQSWDKTSTKGYPPVAPGSVIVWSDAMAEEAQRFLDIPRDRVYVEGAPVWDRYFEQDAIAERQTFCERYGLDAAKPLIYVSLSSQAYHDGNLALIDDVIAARRDGAIPGDCNLLFRIHPGYFEVPGQMDELEDRFAASAVGPGAYLMRPIADRHEDLYMMRPEDDRLMREILIHADVCVEVLSTQMIEAAIFDTPVVDIGYGRWTSRVMDIELGDFTLEHLDRVHRTDAVYRARSRQELAELIRRACANPDERAVARRRLVDQEVPVNRGSAGLHTARRLAALAGAS